MKENLNLTIYDKERIVDVCKALSSPIRLDILEYLSKDPAIITDVAERFNIPLSSAALYIKVLEQAGLISVQPIPGSKGSQKLCGVLVNSVNIDMFPFLRDSKSNLLFRELMPVGNYFDYKAKPSCGMVSESLDLGFEDNIAVFSSPSRFKAQLIWLCHGYLEYRFSNSYIKDNEFKRIRFSLEICSEALGHNNDWRSDVSVIVNDKDLGLIRCMGDYGGRRGRLNPDWWNPASTQYGQMATVEITENGCYIDGTKVSDENIYSLDLSAGDFIKFKLEVREDAEFCGGFNIFGEKFGDYPQGLQMEVYSD